MNNITFSPQLPCLTYALARIGCTPVNTLEELFNNNNFLISPHDFNNEVVPFEEADILVWWHKARDRRSIVSLDILRSKEYQVHFASFHCAVVETINEGTYNPMLTHLVLNGGTTYDVVSEHLKDYLQRHREAQEYITPGLCIRWRGYKPDKVKDVHLSYNISPL